MEKVLEPQPSTPSPGSEAATAELLRTPSCAQEVDQYLDGLISRFDFTPRSTRQLEKVAKAAKRGAVDLVLANREIEDLREAADRQERRKERLPGPAGLILNKDSALRIAEEIKLKRERKDQAKRLADERKKLLTELKARGVVGEKARRLPKAFNGELEERMAQAESNKDTVRLNSLQEYSAIINNQ